MIVRVVLLFLIGILVLAMFGRLKTPKISNPLKKQKILKSRKCPKCGSYILGEGPCACEKRR